MSDVGPFIGWIGLDAPVEVLEAVGRPVRLDVDPAAPAPKAAEFGEGGGHPWMRAMTDRLLEAAPSLERVVIGATPVTGVWLYNFFLTLERGAGAPALPPLELVNISHEDRVSAVTLNRDSIAGLAGRLSATEYGLRLAIQARNAVRACQRRIETLRHGPERRLAGSAARRLLDAADRMTADTYGAMVTDALAEAQAGPSLTLAQVIYSGPGTPSLALYLELEAHGLTVVADDADFGTRAIGPDVDPSLNPIEAIARRYARRSPAPAGWTTRQRVAWLTDLATTRGAEAVILDLPDWQHPPAWDLPAVRSAMAAIGVPCIVAPQSTPAETAAAAAAAFQSLKGGPRAHV